MTLSEALAIGRPYRQKGSSVWQQHPRKTGDKFTWFEVTHVDWEVKPLEPVVYEALVNELYGKGCIDGLRSEDLTPLIGKIVRVTVEVIDE